MKRNRVFIKKNDYDRVVVTETLPFETPLIFSNEGFYLHLKSIEKAEEGSILKALLDFLVTKEPKRNYTIPFFYKVRKNSTEFRKLGILHPSAQWKIRNFYKENADLIIYFCAQSTASIRSPQKIAGSFYQKTTWSNVNQYKNSTVSTVNVDHFTQYSPSFFSYRGYDRLYKFFDSPVFFNLEKKFPHHKTLDVSKCFDSIYTHSLSWAIKDKEFTKNNIDAKNTFPQGFDDLMQYSNHRETNGIIIGPEVSRVFAELILQEIDRIVIQKLANMNDRLLYNTHYCFKRYVDDVFIFSKSADISETVYQCFSDNLNKFNLHTNASKSVSTYRPFISSKTAIIRDISQATNEFIDKFLEDLPTEHRLVPKQIFNRWKITKTFFIATKTLCLHNNASYDDISAYTISMLVERIKKIINIPDGRNINSGENLYRDALLVLIESIFFFYQVSPSVNSSYKVATAIILINRFTQKHISSHTHGIKQEIYDSAESFLKNNLCQNNSVVDNLVNLESINIIIALSDLGENYTLPPDIIDQTFIQKNQSSYLHIVSCLFYTKGNPIYSDISGKLVSIIKEKLSDLKDVRQNTEKALLFLDIMSCPYIKDSEKKQLIIKFFAAIEQPEPSAENKVTFLSTAKDSSWFVNWNDLDLLHFLEKKALKQAY